MRRKGRIRGAMEIPQKREQPQTSSVQTDFDGAVTKSLLYHLEKLRQGDPILWWQCPTLCSRDLS